jgi:hypothetical protein
LRQLGRLGEIPVRFGWRDFSDDHVEIIARHLSQSPRGRKASV